MPLIPWGPFIPDTSDYEGASAHLINNVYPRGDGYGPWQDFTSYTKALPATCRGAFYALNSDGTITTFAGTSTKLYKLSNTDYGWADVSLSAGTYSALSSNAQWQFAQTGNLVWATQANAVLQVFNLSSPATFTNSLGSPPQAAYVSVVGRFLVLSGLLANPYRIQWSGLNNFNASTSWDNVTLGSNLQDLPDGGIVRGVAGGESGLICQDQAFRGMTFIAGSPLTFQIERISQDHGLFAPYSIIRAGDTIFLYTNKGFYKFAGGALTQIGRERIDRTFLADLDRGNLQLFIGAADPKTSFVYWAYKSASGTVGLYDKIQGYDPVLDRFFPISMSGEYLLGISQSGIPLESLDAINGSIDAMILSLDSYATAIQPALAQFNSSHMLGFFAGANLEATLESSEQGTEENKITVRGFRPVTDATALYGSLTYRDTQQATAIRGNEVAISPRTGRCDMMRDTRYARFRTRIPAGTNWTFSAGIVPDTITSGML